MAEFSIQTEGVGEVLSFLNLMSDKLRQPETLLKKMAIYMQTSIDKNFREGGRPEKWKDISPLTKALRRGKGGGKPLRDTGALKKGITYTVSHDEAQIFPTVKYAAVHQTGKTIKPKKGRYLAIPLTKEAKAAGTPTAFKNLSPIFFGGNYNTGILARKLFTGINEPFFFLTKKVTIPARPFMLFQSEDIERMEQMAMNYITSEANQ